MLPTPPSGKWPWPSKPTVWEEAPGMPGGMQPPKDAAPQPPKDTSRKYTMPQKVTIPAKYKVAGTSGLTWDIKAGKNTKDFDLTD